MDINIHAETIKVHTQHITQDWSQVSTERHYRTPRWRGLYVQWVSGIDNNGLPGVHMDKTMN